MSSPGLQSEFLDGPNGSLFCTVFSPPSQAGKHQSVIVHVPPFGEEMNKSRPMVSAQAKKMANSGYVVVLFDLFGTGDSGGDYHEATWERWLDDLEFICSWVKIRHTRDQLILWGLRSGCLLAARMTHRAQSEVSRLLFWQPVVTGERALTHLKRLEQIAGATSVSNSLHAAIEGTEKTLEIAGYELNADLIRTMLSVEIDAASIPSNIQIDWLEISPLRNHQPGAASRKFIDEFRKVSAQPINAEIVQGDPFWSTQEVSIVPELMEITLVVLEQSNSRGHTPGAKQPSG